VFLVVNNDFFGFSGSKLEMRGQKAVHYGLSKKERILP
jgi:hypothetical protein